MRKNISKLLCLLLSMMMLITVFPLSASAVECSHTYTKVYTAENANMHSYVSKCTKCGKVIIGGGYSGLSNHIYKNNTCTKCGYKKVCSHTSAQQSYVNYSTTQHKLTTVCSSCGISLNTVTESHSWNYGTWSLFSETQHSRTNTCICGESKTETASHTFSGNVCTGCGYRKTEAPVVTASVSLSASSPSGILGSAGGEIAAENYPASYTVSASASGCSVTKIVYVMNGRSYTSYGSSVTITANSESEFQTTTFTAYTNVSGVTATFTVNHKIVKKSNAYIMWETTHAATIRSITGNGLNKSLSYTMTIPNSYDSQTNLTEDQIATIQGLFGKSDGKTYMVNYTRIIRVYTPADRSSTGERIEWGTFDGNNSDDIYTCLNTWGWSSQTKEAIRQAASSSLSFTTGLPIDCTAVWIDSSTGKQLYSTSFGSGSVIPSQSTVVSIAYSAYSGSGDYVYESLSYSGDYTGTSISQSYSQTYKATSKPLTVTFYCHPKATSGSITVRAVDGDTNVLIPIAIIKCGSLTGSSNPSTFTNCSLGTYSVAAYASGYGSVSGTATISQTSPNQTVTLKLYKRNGDITVTVRDSATRAVIPSATVSGAGKSGTTNSYGTVSFGDIAFGTYTFTASASGYYQNSGTATISKTSSTNTITIYLDPVPKTGDITVYVRDTNTNALISGATVSGNGYSTATNYYGYATFYGMPFGSYSFSASADGYYPGTGYASISVNSMSASITIYLSPIPTSGDITVTVYDSVTNAKLSGATVSGGGSSKTTGTSGSVSFNNISFGNYTFTASKSGYYSRNGNASVSLNSRTDSISIYLTPIPTSGVITVIVKDSDTGNAISGVTVSGASKSGTTNASGTVTFNGLSFGSYTFTASCSGYESASGSGSISVNNTTRSITIYLTKQRSDLTVDANINGTVYKGSTIMVSVVMSNSGDIALTPDKAATVTMTAKKKDGTVFSTQSNSVICPSNDSNLTWFSVTVPDTDSVTFSFSVKAPAGVSEKNLSNNNDSITVPVYTLPIRSCKDSGMELDAPSGFQYSEYKGQLNPSLSWSVYEWNGGFVKKTYTVKLTLTASLTPDETAGYRKLIGSVWTTRSGYGVNTSLNAVISDQNSAVVGTLKVDAFYPEYAYSTSSTESDNLEQVSGSYVFRKNSSSVSARRFHAIPLWFPDGAYAVKYTAYDLWCPAGMLSGYTNAYVIVDGDMYDDLYTN